MFSSLGPGARAYWVYEDGHALWYERRSGWPSEENIFTEANFIAQIFLCRINIEKILYFVHFYRCRGISTLVRCIFRKRRLLKPPHIKSKTGCPEVDLLTEFHCIAVRSLAALCDSCQPHALPLWDKEIPPSAFPNSATSTDLFSTQFL